MFPSPTRMFLTKGVGVHRYALTAFEFALRDADIEQQNLVYVSSILPPRCQVITREAGSSCSGPTTSPSACWPGRRPMNLGATYMRASAWPSRRIRTCMDIYRSWTGTG
jgi:hypothetical protein